MRNLVLVFAVPLTLLGCDHQGSQGPAGPPGHQGPIGAQGPAGPGLRHAHVHAFMPGDNAATVAVGGGVEFPQDGPANGIFRTTARLFLLTDAGTYEVSWQVPVPEAGQLVLTLNGVELPATVAGRATGTTQISNHVLISVPGAFSLLTVRNPLGNPTALSVTPLASVVNPVSASLVIKRVE